METQTETDTYTNTGIHGNTQKHSFIHRHSDAHTHTDTYLDHLRPSVIHSLSVSLHPSLPFFFFFKFFLSSASSYWTNLSAISQGWISNQDRTFWKPPWASAYFCILLPFLSPTGVLLSECQPYLCLVGISECMQILGVLVKQLQMTTPRLLSPYLYIWSEPEAYLVIYAILFWDLLLSTKNTTLFLTPPAAEWHLCGH